MPSSPSPIAPSPRLSLPMSKLLVIFLSLVLVLSIFGSTPISALPTPQKSESAVGPQNGANFQHFYLENAANFPPIMEKRRSAEFINGLLSLERLNAMGKRAMPPSLLWNMEE